MIIDVSKDNLVLINENLIHTGEYKVNEVIFNFSDEYIETTNKAVFTNYLGSYEVPIIDGRCNIPSEVLKEQEIIKVGVYGYKLENDEYVIRYSPSPIDIKIIKGSYVEGAENGEVITPTQFEIYTQSMNEGLNKIDNALLDLENRVNSGEFKGEKGDTGEKGADGINGTNATINGLETINIVGGDNIDLVQQGSDFYISYNGTEMNVEIVEELPIEGTSNKIYLVLKETGTEENIYNEYLFINGVWEHIGSTAINLTDYYNKEEVNELLNEKADKDNCLKTVSTLDEVINDKEIGVYNITSANSIYNEEAERVINHIKNNYPDYLDKDYFFILKDGTKYYFYNTSIQTEIYLKKYLFHPTEAQYLNYLELNKDTLSVEKEYLNTYVSAFSMNDKAITPLTASASPSMTDAQEMSAYLSEYCLYSNFDIKVPIESGKTAQTVVVFVNNYPEERNDFRNYGVAFIENYLDGAGGENAKSLLVLSSQNDELKYAHQTTTDDFNKDELEYKTMISKEEVNELLDNINVDLPIATVDLLGGIKVGEHLNIDENGSLSFNTIRITGEIDAFETAGFDTNNELAKVYQQSGVYVVIGDYQGPDRGGIGLLFNTPYHPNGWSAQYLLCMWYNSVVIGRRIINSDTPTQKFQTINKFVINTSLDSISSGKEFMPINSDAVLNYYGKKGDLQTTNKTNFVNAINELKTNIDTLNTNLGSVNEILATLTTVSEEE